MKKTCMTLRNQEMSRILKLNKTIPTNRCKNWARQGSQNNFRSSALPLFGGFANEINQDRYKHWYNPIGNELIVFSGEPSSLSISTPGGF